MNLDNDNDTVVGGGDDREVDNKNKQKNTDMCRSDRVYYTLLYYI